MISFNLTRQQCFTVLLALTVCLDRSKEAEKKDREYADRFDDIPYKRKQEEYRAIIEKIEQAMREE